MISILDLDEANFDQVMAVNVRGVMLGMKFAIPHMIKNGSGSIINMSSGSGFRTGFSSHSYCASKAAVTHVTKSVAAEIGGRGVRVNSISPGAIVTGIFAKNAGVEGSKADKVLDVVRETFSTLQPSTRPGMTDDIANAAAFLASDRAQFINGHDMVVDGGITLAGVKWDDGVALRAGLYRRINETIERMNS
jgi:NAD(P)-dependent dehydrogenase (short-subunit alcohol dehydrogenase family)